MTALLQVYKCEICGNIVEVIHKGAGKLVCCGKPMIYLEESTTDAATEKHIPVIEKTEDGYKVTVGSVEHPMMEAHYIEWIELIADGVAYRKFLKPDDKPEATFCIEADNVSTRELCNMHGVWKGE
ncbi:MAG: desulfoferrodoxin [Candidatus Hatepunaea meridiana]|nr:desulfoferrodoxin [Candidatus Hatepunaea meridiana]